VAVANASAASAAFVCMEITGIAAPMTNEVQPAPLPRHWGGFYRRALQRQRVVVRRG
jgi:hypothetical protein